MRQREMDKYTDRTDVNGNISLYEQGFIRNPKTGETLCCLNTYMTDKDISDWHKAREYNVQSQYITFEEVKEVLEDIKTGYFDFIGSTREVELSNLDNEYLTSHIMSINMYDCTFTGHMSYYN